MALVPFPKKSTSSAADDDDWEDDDSESEQGKMSFLDHLDELRRRIIYSLVAILLGLGIALFFMGPLFQFIFRPMQALLPAGQTLIYTDPSEAFFLQIKIALMAGLILASPVVASQLWLFIAPGLYAHEKKLAIPFVVMSSTLFVGGAAFAHYLVFPIVWRFFVSFTNDFLTFMPRVEPAFSMYLRLVLALGITFQLPTLVLFLARLGIVTPRLMIRHFKYAVLLIVIASAVLSPDGGGVGMLAMGGPVIVLYILSIGLAWLFGKKRTKTLEEAS
ncbi:MAG TPA: twin-arginine translocase subunit TatC [Vicinamibacterales bacterium]|nr:twin-arginine translocase subunit TatC [Vicinamibacterales bacterium]